MSSVALRTMPFDLPNASEHEYAALNEFDNRMRAERLPDDPPIPLDEAIQDARNIPSFVHPSLWAVWNPEETRIVATGSIWIIRAPENQHFADIGIDVLPELRRQGIARRLLSSIVEVAQRENRRLLIGATSERIPAGAAFMERIGATRGLEMHTNQLLIGDLDRDLIRSWIEQGEQRAAEFELGVWDGRYPEEQIKEIAKLNNVMNTAPKDNLDLEDWNFTPEVLREFEQSMEARGGRRWTMYVCERATGAFAGFTEVFWHPNRPQILEQGATGVFPHYRNKGLGRWVKAAMLDKVLRERPEVTFVRTGNANSNGPMLKINHELGFKPYESRCVWQVETAKLLTYLGQGQEAIPA